MPKQGSNSDKLDDWDKMVTVVLKNQAELPDLEPYRGPLEQALLEARARGAERRSQLGLKLQETVDFKDLMRTGDIYAGKLRAALRAHYGFQSERLQEYGILPMKGRKRQPKPEPPPPGPAPETPEIQAVPKTAEAPKPEGPAPTPQDTASQES